MKRTYLGLSATLAAVGVCSLVAGCSGEAESWTEYELQGEGSAAQAADLHGVESSSNRAAGTDQANGAELLAELHPSETHRIIVEREADGEVSVTETFNVDQVAYEESFTYNRFSGLSAEDAYDLIAGDDWSQETRELFVDVGRQLDSSVKPAVIEEIDSLEAAHADDIRAWGEQSPEHAGAIETAEATKAEAVNGTALVEKACSDPSGFNFQADDGRFKQIFCGTNSKFCVTSGQESNGFASYGFDRTKFMAAVGLSQSFCNTARFRYWKRHYDGFPTYGISDSNVKDVQLPPRNFFGHHRSNSSGDWAYKARIDHVSGPAIRRVAFSIHVDSSRPPWFNTGFPSSF